MSIVCGLITFIAFYIDMIWMNCIYPEMEKNKKTSEEIDANSKRSSLICMIVLAIIVAISCFAKLSDILLFASSASLFMCGLKYLTFTKLGKIFKVKDKAKDYDEYWDDWEEEDDEDYQSEDLFDDINDGEEFAFEEYDVEYDESAFVELFQKYNGEEAETSIEAIEDNVDDEIIDVIDGKTYI